MPPPKIHPFQNAVGWGLLALAVPLLAWVANSGQTVHLDPQLFVFWHTVVEMFAVVVAMLIFATGYRAILSVRKGAVVFLGIAFLGVGVFDFLHTMSYSGMPDAITPNSPHKSMFFWLIARVLAASSLLVYTLLPNGAEVTTVRRRVGVALVVVLVLLAGPVGLMWPDQVPALFVPGQGQTALKVGLEWLLICLNLSTLLVLWLRRAQLVHEAVRALGFTVGLAAVSELFFTQIGIVDKDVANAMGHFYKVASYLFLFQATFNESMRRPLERLQTQNLREKVVLNSAPDGVLWVNGEGRILMANPVMQVLTGYTTDELVGQGVEVFLPQPMHAQHAQLMREYFLQPRPRAMGAVDLKLMRKDGHMLPVSIALGDWVDDGERHAIAYIRDLTESKKYEESLRHQASHDELTGLANRWQFRQELADALVRGHSSGKQVAVLLLDLDHFQAVNDGFGHAIGDALLVQVGQRVRSHLRPADTLARMGGDEFGVLMADLHDVDIAVGQAARLLAALQTSFSLNGEEVYAGGSIGLAFYPMDGADSDTLLRFADMALYKAKDNGRGVYACYSPELERKVQEDMRLHTRLKDAMSQGKLQLHYQPQVDVRTGAIVGAEALLRWDDPVLGYVSPARFIPVAEATGLILPLSEWVMETACTQMAQWQLAGMPLRVAVNVSAQQFRQRDLPQKIRTLLDRTGAQACWLDVEITESVAMSQPEHAREQLNALAAFGCGVALDDFGTGYSSLAYLKALPVSKLKIDKSFMDGIPEDPNDESIARAIIALAKSLGLSLVAEGVETQAQLAFLLEQGCEVYQGWLFAKAMPAAELTALLQRT
ncbi:MAG: EAL domain-containing protein [Burkholderiales bacterium]|nr:EAL domain-containing protein [Burkholderiales bacterium]